MDMFVFSVGMDSSENALSHVDVIVLDEVHYLSDISRGTVWEEIVSGCYTHITVKIYKFAYVVNCCFCR